MRGIATPLSRLAMTVLLAEWISAKVAVMPYEDVELLEELEEQLDLRAAMAALKEAEEEGPAFWDDLKRALGVA